MHPLLAYMGDLKTAPPNNKKNTFLSQIWTAAPRMTRKQEGSANHAAFFIPRPRGVVGVEVDVGEELQQHPLGRLHHPVGDGGGDPAGPGHPAHPPHLALVGQLGGAEALPDGAAE